MSGLAAHFQIETAIVLGDDESKEQASRAGRVAWVGPVPLQKRRPSSHVADGSLYRQQHGRCRHVTEAGVLQGQSRRLSSHVDEAGALYRHHPWYSRRVADTGPLQRQSITFNFLSCCRGRSFSTQK